MTNPDVLFLILKLLEDEPLTSNQLQMKGALLDCEHSLKTFQRAISDLEQLGVTLIKERHNYSLPKKEKYCLELAIFFKKMLAEKASWQSFVYGDIDSKALTAVLKLKQKPTAFLLNLIDATYHSTRITFDYTASHGPTERREKLGSGKIMAKGVNHVSMIIHYLVFSGSHFLALGESTLAEQIDIRQYEVSGIGEIKIGQAEKKQVDINPHELYRHSLQVWLGGEVHDITLEEIDRSGKSIRMKTAKVNGEEEILSQVMASLGRVKIVNPPESIIAHATYLDLPQKLIFKFD